MKINAFARHRLAVAAISTSAVLTLATVRAADVAPAPPPPAAVPATLPAGGADAAANAAPADAPPATQPEMSAAEQQAVDQIRAGEAELRTVLTDPSVFSDPAKRTAAQPQAMAALNKLSAAIDALARAQPRAAEQATSMKRQLTVLSSALGDAPATAALAKRAADPDATTALSAQTDQLAVRWYQAGEDAAAQGKVVDDVEKLDKAHPADDSLAEATAGLLQGAATPEPAGRLRALVTDTMTGPVAQQIKQQVVAEAEAKAKLAANENKPLVLAGKTPDGKDFTTADWKGKVVMVDFWATWCGPCRAELPHVKDVYAKYHDKGLEIVGVSNDYDAETLKRFTAEQQMPWPQLLDASAAAQQQWNPLAVEHGVTSIPTVFLIDKKGVVRTVEGREKMDEMIPKLLAE